VLGNLTYEYAPNGKRVKVGGSFARTGMPQALTSAVYGTGNQLTQRAGNNLTYDHNGNLTSDGTNTYTWNARNELASISGPGLTATFQYDASGKRINKTVNGTSTNFLYDGPNVVQELSGTTPTANLLNGGVDNVFTRTDANGARTPLKDHLGSTLALADDAGTLQTQYTYDPFGNTTSTGSTSANSSKFTGREDDGTGLYYYRARYYSPSLQRFISEDPIGLAAGDVNVYAYVLNDPINIADPSGLCGMFSIQGAQTTAQASFDWPLFWDLVNAAVALQRDSCRKLFGSNIDPITLLGQLAAGNAGVGSITRGDLGGLVNGNVENARTTGILGARVVTRPDGTTFRQSTFTGANIVLNNNPASPYMSGYNNRFGANDAVNRAITLIHELGHAAVIIYGTNASRIVDDQNDPTKSSDNSRLVFDECFRQP
jgi:RHS repeat-associated protein